jgi:hypothetical protein
VNNCNYFEEPNMIKDETLINDCVNLAIGAAALDDNESIQEVLTMITESLCGSQELRREVWSRLPEDCRARLRRPAIDQRPVLEPGQFILNRSDGSFTIENEDDWEDF